MSRNSELVFALSKGHDWPGLTAAECKMLEYARKLTVDPASVREEEVDSLRATGFSDRAILETNLAVSYMNFVNRVAEGLGVEIEPSIGTFRR